VVYGEPAYLGAQKREEVQQDEHLRQVEFRANKRPSSNKTLETYDGINWDKQIESQKSAVRSKVEHIFLIVKKQFGYAKVAYRGIEKNLNRCYVLFASANLLLCARAGRSEEFCRG